MKLYELVTVLTRHLFEFPLQAMACSVACFIPFNFSTNNFSLIAQGKHREQQSYKSSDLLTAQLRFKATTALELSKVFSQVFGLSTLHVGSLLPVLLAVVRAVSYRLGCGIPRPKLPNANGGQPPCCTHESADLRI